MTRPITKEEIEAPTLAPLAVDKRASIPETYRHDVLVCRRRLKTYPSDSDIYAVLVREFTYWLRDKYLENLDDDGHVMPADEVEIIADLVGWTSRP